MMRRARRLPVRAALTCAAGALAGTVIAVVVWLAVSDPHVLMTPDERAALFALLLLLPIAGAALSAAWFTSRQVRLVRDALDRMEQAMPGRVPRRGELTETEQLSAAVRDLVDSAERSSRMLSQRQAYAAVGDFASELARELAPSVASARSSLRSVEKHLHLDSPLRAPLDSAVRELHRLSNTLQDTLRLARSGRLTSRRLDLWLPLRAAARTVSADASLRGVRVDVPPHGRDPMWVHGDPDALEQLFLNLLVNAVQATESSGLVSVRVAVSDDVVVTISDTGAGIPEGALDRVFEPFYSTKPERAGLGLAIAWRTAAAHGGKLSIESALGRGTTVHVALPRAEDGGAYALG